MKNLLMKEFKLVTLPLTYLFLLFSLMTFIPGYPILCGAFFVCLGIFQSYQRIREDNDILYSVLLPVSKSEVVKAKYITVVLLQMTAFAICIVCTVVRMTFLSDVRIYTTKIPSEITEGNLYDKCSYGCEFGISGICVTDFYSI